MPLYFIHKNSFTSWAISWSGMAQDTYIYCR